MKEAGIFIGSPRKNGNTAILSRWMSASFEEAQVHATEYFLYDYNIKPCIDCRKCKKDTMECVYIDSSAELYRAMENSDVIVFATPIYWYSPTATTKLLMDRLRPFYGNNRLQGKKMAALLIAGSGGEDCTFSDQIFRRTAETLGMQYIGSIPFEAYNEGDIQKDKRNREEISRLVREICNQ